MSDVFYRRGMRRDWCCSFFFRAWRREGDERATSVLYTLPRNQMLIYDDNRQCAWLYARVYERVVPSTIKSIASHLISSDRISKEGKGRGRERKEYPNTTSRGHTRGMYGFNAIGCNIGWPTHILCGGNPN